MFGALVLAVCSASRAPIYQWSLPPPSQGQERTDQASMI